MTYQAETVTVKLPIPIYRRLKRVAEITYRSVEDVLASTVDAALPLDPNLPSDVADDVAAMALITTMHSWQRRSLRFRRRSNDAFSS